MIPFVWPFKMTILEMEERLVVAKGLRREWREGGDKEGRKPCGYERATREIITGLQLFSILTVAVDIQT